MPALAREKIKNKEKVKKIYCTLVLYQSAYVEIQKALWLGDVRTQGEREFV